MIRVFREQDLDRVMEIWLMTNISAHDFVDGTYWRGNYDAVKRSLPSARVYVYEEDHDILGFVGLMERTIAGIFVSQQVQSKGIGKQLLDRIKLEEERLSLQVYKENDKALRFYLREGFELVEERMDEATGTIELCMNWTTRR